MTSLAKLISTIAATALTLSGACVLTFDDSLPLNFHSGDSADVSEGDVDDTGVTDADEDSLDDASDQDVEMDVDAPDLDAPDETPSDVADPVDADADVNDADASDEPDTDAEPQRDVHDEPDPQCIPDCDDATCGDDGCGGVCGECFPGIDCRSRQCQRPRPSDRLSCIQFNQCLIDCGGGCQDECQFRAEDGAVETYTRVIACIADHCAHVAEDPQAMGECQIDHCQPELEDCQGRSLFGSARCGDVIACTTGCADNDCFNSCVAEGTREAQRAASDLFSCAQPECVAGDPGFMDCAQGVCGAQWSACNEF